MNTDSYSYIEFEKLKEKLREATIRYDTYLNDYCSRYEESIKRYESVYNELSYREWEFNKLENKYAQLVYTLQQLKRIMELYPTIYELHINKIKQEHGITLSPEPAIQTKYISEVIDRLLKDNPVTNPQRQAKEKHDEEQERNFFYALIDDKYIMYYECRKKIFDFMNDYIKDSTPQKIMIFLLLSKKQCLLKTLPTPVQVRNAFNIKESRFKKLYGYENFNVNDKHKFKQTQVEQISIIIANFKEKLFNFPF